MWNLMKMELRSTSFKWANILIVLLYIFRIAMVLILKDSELNYTNEIYFISVFFLVFFLSDTEVDKIDVIKNSIPIDKKNLVLSRYLIVPIIFILSHIYTIFYFEILKVLGVMQSEPLYVKHLIVSLSIFIIYSSILLPFYHIMPTLTSSIGFVAFFTISSIVKNNIRSIEKLLLGMNSIMFLLVSITIMIVSIFISLHFYNKREFVRR